MDRPPIAKEPAVQIDDVTLMALADGELDHAEASRVQALIAGDLEAQARFRRFSESRDRLRALAAASDDATDDAKLIARIRAASVTSALSAQPVPQSRPANRNRAPMAALAAALTAAVIGLGWWQGPQTPQSSAPVLSADVVAALSSLPSGEGRLLDDGRDLTIIASYSSDDVEICREYETSRDGLMQVVVACRADDAWTQRFAVELTAPDGYQPATGDIPGLDAYLAQSAAGEPLTLEEEAALLGQ